MRAARTRRWVGLDTPRSPNVLPAVRVRALMRGVYKRPISRAKGEPEGTRRLFLRSNDLGTAGPLSGLISVALPEVGVSPQRSAAWERLRVFRKDRGRPECRPRVLVSAHASAEGRSPSVSSAVDQTYSSHMEPQSHFAWQQARSPIVNSCVHPVRLCPSGPFPYLPVRVLLTPCPPKSEVCMALPLASLWLPPRSSPLFPPCISLPPLVGSFGRAGLG